MPRSRGKERLEDLFLHFRWHAGAVCPPSDRPLGAVAFDVDGDAALRVHGLRGVHQHVLNRDLQLLGVDRGDGAVPGDIDHDAGERGIALRDVRPCSR